MVTVVITLRGHLGSVMLRMEPQSPLMSLLCACLTWPNQESSAEEGLSRGQLINFEPEYRASAKVTPSGQNVRRYKVKSDAMD